MHMFNPMAEDMLFAHGIIYGHRNCLDQDSIIFSNTEIKPVLCILPILQQVWQLLLSLLCSYR